MHRSTSTGRPPVQPALPAAGGPSSPRGTRRAFLAGSAVLLAAGCSSSTKSTSAASGSSSAPAASAGAASSTSSGAAGGDPTATINVVGILDPVADGMNTILAAFKKAHPTITVDYQFVSFDNLNSVLDARVTNKSGNPDVYWADEPRVPALASRGYAEDLTSMFAGQISSLQTSGIEACTYDGKLWALPIADSTQLLYYNKMALTKAGVAFPSADPKNPITWEQLATDAAKVKAAGAAQYGMLFGQFDRYYQLEPLVVGLGGSRGASGKDNLTPDITSPAWVKAFTWYHDLFTSGAAPRGVPSEQTDALFVGGKAGYEVEGPWLLPTLNTSKIEWGVAMQPKFAGGTEVTPTGSWSLAMNPFTKNKAAAAVFMKWMAIDNGSGYENNRPAPELPANKIGQVTYFKRPVFDTPAGKQAVKIIDYATANTAVPRLSTVGYIEFETILFQTFGDIRNGQSAQAALTSASSQLTTAWAKYK